jgi:two-component system cell cycle sensor histidine kinase/response regulator CckA
MGERPSESARLDEEHLGDLVDSSHDLILSLRPDGTFLYTNRAWRDTLGYDSEAISRLTVFDIVHPAKRDYLQQTLQRLAAGEQLVQVETVFVAKDGRALDLEGRVQCRLEHGRPVAIRGIFRDVTERRRLEKEARHRQRLLDEGQQLVHLGSWEWDIVANRVTWSDELYRLFGLKPGQFGSTYEAFIEYVHPDDRAPIQAGVDRARKRGEPFAQTHRIVRPDGTQRTVTSQGKVIVDEGGRPVRMLGTCQDVTEREQAEARRRQTEAQIQHAQKLESLGVLAGGVAHDFNNLLTAMLGYTSLARSMLPADAPIVPLLLEVEKAAERAAELTQRMLAYSGKGRFVAEPCNLSVLVRDMAKLLETIVSPRAVLRLELNPRLPLIEGDAAQLRQVITGLISNASEALGDKEGVITVRTGVVTADADSLRSAYLADDLPGGEYVFVEVIDTGCGMGPETLARVFEPFFSTKFVGRGLGLAATLGVVRGHRGAVKVTSAVGQGSTFQLFIPRAGGERAASTPDADLLAWRDTGTILAVDDEEGIRLLAQTVLQQAGFRVVVAHDGQEGIEVFQKHPEIVLVLLDLTMPRRGGVQALEVMRRLRDHIPVVLMSGYSLNDMPLGLVKEGLVGFLQKPFTATGLLAAVKRALAGKTEA